jgi:hypothetical protein
MIRVNSAKEGTVQGQVGADLLDRLVRHLCEEVPGAVGAAVSVLRGNEPPVVVSSVGVAEQIDTLQWRLVDGPLPDARRTEQPVISDDLTNDERWPRLRQVLQRSHSERVAGAIVVPGSWDGAGPMLISTYLRNPPTEEDAQRVARLEPMLAHALAFVEFCSGEVLRADQMLQMMQYRRVIEQAKGLVIAALNVDSSGAFETLTRASQHFNVRLRDLAIALVEHVGKGAAEQPEDPTAITEPSRRAREAGELVWKALQRGVEIPPAG